MKILFSLILALSLPGLLLADVSRTCTPTSTSESCVRTQSCSVVFPPPPSPFRLSLLDMLTYQYDISYLQNVYNMMKRKVNELRRKVVRLHNAWIFSSSYTAVGNRGLVRLYPIRPNQPSMSDIHTNITHSQVLGELRWWFTAVEEHAMLLRACGLLGSTDGEDLVTRTSLVSEDINHMLRYLSINPSNFTAQALCAQMPSTLTDSYTKRAEYTSVALRDLERALERINTVLHHCSITNHYEGQHQAKLQCNSPYQHLFYHNHPSDVSSPRNYSYFLI